VLGTLLSGSGPTCLFLTGSEGEAHEVRDLLAGTGVTTLVAQGPVPGATVVDRL
jgi:4-diphosphocytidyl-2-C-methyl-D-erythritol kinase